MTSIFPKQSKRIPFHSQKWDLNQWENLGFKNKEDAEYWQNSSCGVLCLKMAAEGLLAKDIDSISHIIERGVNMRAYSHAFGWSHDGLVNLAKHYGLKAYSHKRLQEKDLKQLLDQGALIIVSIKWAFEPKKSIIEKIFFWKKKGGHLALVIGYEEDRGFIINHTSISLGYNWEGVLIPFKKFNRGFTGRGIIINS